MNRKERESNIELLRIVAMIGVIILHINNPSIGGLINNIENDSITRFVIYFFESLFATAVNMFILISGYFMINNNKRNFWKVIELIFQVILFNVLIYLLNIAIHEDTFEVKRLIKCLLPVNYYAILYCTLYIISPYINILIQKVRNIDFMIIMLFIIFSIIPTAVDILIEVSKNDLFGLSTIGMYGSQYGYSIVQFILMYMIGGYIRKKEFKFKTSKLILLLLISSIMLTIWAYINDKIGYYTERTAWEYCNPILILECCIVFLLFKNINFKNNNIINILSRATFTVYLLHRYTFKFFISNIIANKNTVLLLIEIIIISNIIYFFCFIIDCIYKMTVQKIFDRIEKNVLLNYSIETNDNN